jgi:hypothetical protein
MFFAFCASASGEPNFTGEISVGSVTGAPGETVAVPVYLHNNNIQIAALTVPLKYSSQDLDVDSITFVGSLLKYGMTPLVHIDNDNRFCRFTYYPGYQGSPLIGETDGLLATVHFSVDASASDQTVSVDSVNKLDHPGPPELWTRLEVADGSGNSLFFPDFTEGTVTVELPLDADDDRLTLPDELELRQNFPNPFNPSTTIAFNLPERSHVLLRVYNILGQEIETLVDETRNPGAHEVNWQASNQASGVYFYRLVYKNQVLTKKMALLK